MSTKTHLDPKTKKLTPGRRLMSLIIHSNGCLRYLENRLSSEAVRPLIIIRRPNFLL